MTDTKQHLTESQSDFTRYAVMSGSWTGGGSPIWLIAWCIFRWTHVAPAPSRTELSQCFVLRSIGRWSKLASNYPCIFLVSGIELSIGRNKARTLAFEGWRLGFQS